MVCGIGGSGMEADLHSVGAMLDGESDFSYFIFFSVKSLE